MGEIESWRYRPNAPAGDTVLIAASALTEGAVTEIVHGRGRSSFRMLMLRYKNTIRAYLNLCPHFSLPLNATRGFLSDDGARIRCLHHFAEFDPANGACLAGACEGSGLESIAVRVDDGGLVRISPRQD